jgi:Meiotically up-regulated gene 113
MSKQQILAEIRRTARANAGVPLGQARFSQETGIRYGDWFGKHWSRWGDALAEAGFAPRKMQGAYAEDVLIESYIKFIRELGRIPVRGELRLKRQSDHSFPSYNVFDRFGSKGRLISRVLKYCREHSGFDDVIQLCGEVAANQIESCADLKSNRLTETGAVYLLKSGRYYKIGKTNAVGRREYELAIQLPEKPRTVHVIRTDDPSGIESYWHERFAAKRTNGEWFELATSDIQAFKRRKFM